MRYARTKAVLEAEPELGLGSPTVAWVDAAFRAMGEIRRARLMPAKIRQPLMLIAAGRDEVVSTAGDRGLRACGCAPARISSWPARATRLMMEQDRYRAQFWAAFDAFVPGTPLFK